MQAYETQDRKAARAPGPEYVWRCAKCGRFLARIERLDGVLEVYHKCGAMNRLAGVLPQGNASCEPAVSSERS